MIYPWQTEQWQHLKSQYINKRLPHAIMLTGIHGTGKTDFASAFASYLLCKHPVNDEACAECSSCQLIKAGNHPDLLMLSPEDSAKAIKVDEVRELCQSFTLTSQFEGYKVAIIDQADQMNINAANSLLKTLEEPNDHSLLILVSSRPHRLPITIRSRCQLISFQAVDSNESSEWLKDRIKGDVPQLLKLAYGAPLLAQQLAEGEELEQRRGLLQAFLSVTRREPYIEYAEKLAKNPKQCQLDWLYSWVSDLIKLQQYGQTSDLINQDYRKELQDLSMKLPITGLYQLLDQIIKLIKVQSISLNSQMFWEDLLISWDQLTNRS